MWGWLKKFSDYTIFLFFLRFYYNPSFPFRYCGVKSIYFLLRQKKEVFCFKNMHFQVMLSVVKLLDSTSICKGINMKCTPKALSGCICISFLLFNYPHFKAWISHAIIRSFKAYRNNDRKRKRLESFRKDSIILPFHIPEVISSLMVNNHPLWFGAMPIRERNIVFQG